MVTRIPFSREDLDAIFRFSPTRQSSLFSRENSTLEFKESFGWASLSMYLKTCVAFANARGGYLVFGVTDKLHIPVGLLGASLKAFQDMDPEKMTQSFNDYFSPEIAWEIQECELHGKTIGLMFVHESTDKPVMCIKYLGKDLHESDVYYRYRAQSERIKYPELKGILETRRAEEEKLWMRHLESISRIGVRDAGVYDPRSGQVAGPGGSFLIDESLLQGLSFIKKGEFSEVTGKPTLRLVGRLESIGSLPAGVRVITEGIHSRDIVLAFLDQRAIPMPEEFIKSICFENSAFLPVFYYMSKAGLDWSKTVEMLNGVVCRSGSRTKLIERLETDRSEYLPLRTGKYADVGRKHVIANSLREEEDIDGILDKDVGPYLLAIRSLSREDVKSHSKYLRGLLKAWFVGRYNSADPTLASYIRRPICWVDEALYDGGNA